MYVDIFAVNLQRSAKRLDEYLNFLEVADAYELDGLTVEDFYYWALEACSLTFARIARPVLPITPTLIDYLNPETCSYSLCANENDQLE